MEHLELLYDHYKETYSLVKARLDERNKLFIYIVILLCVLSLFILNPEGLLATLSEWLDENYHLKINMEVNIIQSLLWFIVLYVTIRYYQANSYIERLYKYIHSLEATISSLTGRPFDRESKSYLEEYPILLDFISIIYRVVFPLIYCFVIMVKLISEIAVKPPKIFLYLDISLAACCLLLTVFYLVFLHKQYVINKFTALLNQERTRH